MKQWRIALGLAFFAALMSGHVSVHAAGPTTKPAATAAAGSPEAALTGKGLTRVGTTYVLPGDLKMPELLRTMRAVQRRVDVANKRRADLERDLRSAERQYEQWVAQNESLTQQLEHTSKDALGNYNQLVDTINPLRAKLRQAEPILEAKRTALQAVEDPTDEYLDALMKAADLMEATAAAYEKVTGDTEVAAAISAMNREPGRPKMRVGPSVGFAQELPNVRRLRDAAASKPIPLDVHGNVARIEVTINGVSRVTMILDSGASDILLNADTAAQLGLHPGPNDPVVEARIANGTMVRHHVMKLTTVQVGPFTVENLECAVASPAQKDTPNLLGGEFLRHFVYKLDLATGQLRLSQISGKPAVEAAMITSKPPAPATRPAPKINATPIHVTVAAGTGWNSTEFPLAAGKCYRITAGGTWTTAAGVDCGADGVCPKEWATPLGPQPGMTADQASRWYLNTQPRGALVARVGDEDKVGFFVGTGQTFVAPTSGKLWLRINDGDDVATRRSGKMEVTFVEVEPQWVDAKGATTVFARIDAADMLHLTTNGAFWEWGGQWGRVGEHDGHYPTIINGILWFPTWADDRHTRPLPTPGLDPRRHVELGRVIARRGHVELIAATTGEVVLRFTDEGLGSSQVGCELKVGSP